MSFKSACEEAAEFAKKMGEPLIAGHYDADGITSTSVTAMAVRALGRKFRTITYRKLGEKEMEELKKLAPRDIIFCDFGAVMDEEIAGLGANALIIDHHQPRSKKSEVMQVNPHFFGIDGGTELCSATTAYSVFGGTESIDIALVGACGDMQIPLIGENRNILEKAVKMGRAKAEIDLILFGRVSRPLTQFLEYCTEPFLPGLTADADACAEFLEKTGVGLKSGDKWRSYGDLNGGEKKKLVSALVLYLEQHGTEGIDLIGEVYTLAKRPEGSELYDAKEFSTLLNACGRHDRPEVGIALCMDEEGAYEKARVLLQIHRKALRAGIEYAQKAVQDFGPYYFLDARGVIDDGIVGVVAGMLYSILKHDKPIIAIALDENRRVKVSGRATKALVGKGINLGRAMREAGGPGCGGHAIAAGANIEPERLNEFLKGLGGMLEADNKK